MEHGLSLIEKYESNANYRIWCKCHLYFADDYEKFNKHVKEELLKEFNKPKTMPKSNSVIRRENVMAGRLIDEGISIPKNTKAHYFEPAAGERSMTAVRTGSGDVLEDGTTNTPPIDWTDTGPLSMQITEQSHYAYGNEGYCKCGVYRCPKIWRSSVVTREPAPRHITEETVRLLEKNGASKELIQYAKDHLG